jgi:hypothetical protein
MPTAYEATSGTPRGGAYVKQVNKAREPDIDIIDIRRDAIETSLKHEITSMLNPARGARQLPTLLLYSERGLQLYEKVATIEPAF